ncbi:MAG: ParA family protein [Ignavibacteriaceae bacterium]
MRKIIAVAVPKGGVGKTTTAVNLAASFAIAEKKTLLIDFDPAGACAISLGYDNGQIKADIFDVFSFSKSISQVIYKTDLENLDFIPTKIENVMAEERMGRITGNSLLFKHILEQLVLTSYDFVIIDCPPYLKGLTTIAMMASDSVIIPVKAGQFSISSLKKMMDYMLHLRTMNDKLKVEGILFTMYEPRTNAWVITERELRRDYAGYIFNTTIPKSTSLTESEFYGKPAVLVKAKTRGALAYLSLADEILNKNPGY